jgi:hypothetical protein
MPQVSERLTWTTRDGFVLTPEQMSTDHIINALRVIKRRCERRCELQHQAELTAACGALSGMGGEEAQRALNNEIGEMRPKKWTEVMPPIAKAFLEELKRRLVALDL